MNKIILQKRVQLLIALKSNQVKGISHISKITNTTYSYVSLMLNNFEKQGFLTLSTGKDPRSKVPTLTQKGNEVADLLIKLRELI